MPKKSKDFPDQLSFNVETETRLALMALGYLWGHGGEYAGPARAILGQGVRKTVAELPEDVRKQYDEILADVKLREKVGREVKRDRSLPA